MSGDGGDVVEIKPLSPARATERIRLKAKSLDLTTNWTKQVRERLNETGLLMGDVLHVLKNGFVHADATESSRPGMFKYQMEAPTPNSNNRTVRVVLIPSPQKCELKIIDVMWVDEPMIKS